jgi:hypothetical protein
VVHPFADSNERMCLEEQILIAPGTMFSASDSYRNCIRNCGALNIVEP